MVEGPGAGDETDRARRASSISGGEEGAGSGDGGSGVFVPSRASSSNSDSELEPSSNVMCGPGPEEASIAMEG